MRDREEDDMSRRVGRGRERFAVVHRRGLLRAMGAVVIALPLFVFSMVQGALNLRNAVFTPIEDLVPTLEVTAAELGRSALGPQLDLVDSLLPPCHRQPLCFLASDPP
jgi:hypothetical protein